MGSGIDAPGRAGDYLLRRINIFAATVWKT
jgi:hypothetical protein